MTCTPGTLTNCTGQNRTYAPPFSDAFVLAPPFHRSSHHARLGPSHVSAYAWPAQLAQYTTKWIAGAKNTWGLDIDYVGSWNERSFSADYLKTLRTTLDANGFNKTMIIAPDSGWDPISGDS